MFNRHNLTQHDSRVTVKKSDTGKTLAVLEGIDDEGLAWLKDDLGGFVGLEGVGGFGLLATSLLANLPLELGDLTGGTTTTDETDGGVTWLDFTWNVEGLNLSGKGLDVLQGRIFLVDHDITDTGHVVLVKTLDVHTNVITGNTLFDLLVVHFDGKDLSGTGIGRGVGGQEDDFLVGHDGTLFDTPGDHITDTLDLVDTTDGETHGGIVLALRQMRKVVQGLLQGGDGVLVTLDVGNINTLPPTHLFGLGQQVVTNPTGNGQDRNRVQDKVLLPSDLDQHVAHFVTDFIVTVFLVPSSVRVHLVDTDDQLLDTEQVQQTSVLTGLTLNVTGLVEKKINTPQTDGPPSRTLWSPFWMAVVKLPSAGTINKATSAAAAPEIMFLMKSRWPGASMMV